MFQKKKGQLYCLKVIRLSDLKVIRLSESYSPVWITINTAKIPNAIIRTKMNVISFDILMFTLNWPIAN